MTAAMLISDSNALAIADSFSTLRLCLRVHLQIQYRDSAPVSARDGLYAPMGRENP